MNKIVIICLVVAMVVGIVGCGEKKVEASSTPVVVEREIPEPTPFAEIGTEVVAKGENMVIGKANVNGGVFVQDGKLTATLFLEFGDVDSKTITDTVSIALLSTQELCDSLGCKTMTISALKNDELTVMIAQENDGTEWKFTPASIFMDKTVQEEAEKPLAFTDDEWTKLYNEFMVYFNTWGVDAELDLKEVYPPIRGIISNVDKDVNVRSEASTDSDVLGKANLGDVFEVLTKDYSDGWHEISFNGTKGYISDKYFVIESEGNTVATTSNGASATPEQNPSNPTREPVPTLSTPSPQSKPAVTEKPSMTPTPVATEKSGTNNNDASYQVILDEYSSKLKSATPGLVSEYNAEASANAGGIEGLATICNNKISKLAGISTEGVGKMASVHLKSGSGAYSEYEAWAGELTDVYMTEAAKITDAYMNSLA